MSIEFVDLGAERLELLRISPDRRGPALVFLHEGLGSLAGWRDGLPASRGLGRAAGAARARARRAPRARRPQRRRFHPAFRLWNIEAELPKIRCPVLAIQGHDDQYGTMEQLDRIGRGVPQATLLKLEQCGHAPQRDQPERVMQAIGELYARASDAA